jgi:hypothetical protein
MRLAAEPVESGPPKRVMTEEVAGPAAFAHGPGLAKFQMEALPAGNRHRHAAS